MIEGFGRPLAPYIDAHKARTAKGVFNGEVKPEIAATAAVLAHTARTSSDYTTLQLARSAHANAVARAFLVGKRSGMSRNEVWLASRQTTRQGTAYANAREGRNLLD